MISIWALIVTWICLVIIIATQIFVWRTTRRTVQLKDRTIALKDLELESARAELRATRLYCAAALKFQHNAIDMALAKVASMDRTFMPSKWGGIWEAVVAGNEAIQWLEAMAKPPSFECPECHRVSYNANDIANRYCGACHAFFPPAQLQPRRRHLLSRARGKAMNRAEHMAWAKQRALEELERSGWETALASMLSDLGKHEETERSVMGGSLAASTVYDRASCRRWIEGFN